MAGTSKPNIVKLGKEGKIKFLEYNDQNRFDKIESLLDNDINAHTKYGVLLYSASPIITFEIYQKSNIYAYSQNYNDSAGNTPYPVKLYKKNNDGIFEYLKTQSTKSYEYYLLFDSLESGIYQIKYTSSYTKFTEWYVENLNPYKYLIEKDNKYYSIKPEYYKNNKYESLEIELTKESIEKYGFKELKDLLLPMYNDYSNISGYNIDQFQNSKLIICKE